MRLLEALNIFEAAVIECKARNVDTPEAREALDAVQPYVKPGWYIEGFFRHLQPSDKLSDHEGQQQNLRVNFAGIHRCIRALLDTQIGRLGGRYAKTKDPAVKAEIDRLSAELAKMPERWEFRGRKILSDP